MSTIRKLILVAILGALLIIVAQYAVAQTANPPVQWTTAERASWRTIVVNGGGTPAQADCMADRYGAKGYRYGTASSAPDTVRLQVALDCPK